MEFDAETRVSERSEETGNRSYLKMRSWKFSKLLYSPRHDPRLPSAGGSRRESIQLFETETNSLSHCKRLCRLAEEEHRVQSQNHKNVCRRRPSACQISDKGHQDLDQTRWSSQALRGQKTVPLDYWDSFNFRGIHERPVVSVLGCIVLPERNQEQRRYGAYFGRRQRLRDCESSTRNQKVLEVKVMLRGPTSQGHSSLIVLHTLRQFNHWSSKHLVFTEQIYRTLFNQQVGFLSSLLSFSFYNERVCVRNFCSLWIPILWAFFCKQL